MDNQSHQESLDTDNIPQEKLPSWTSFPLKKFNYLVNHSAGVIMDHYLIVLIRDFDIEPRKYINSVLVFDLHDHSVQEAIIQIDCLEKGEFRLLNYKRDRIILYDALSLACVTVKCEEIKNPNSGPFSVQTAQIFQDYLYVYGRRTNDSPGPKNKCELWRFDLQNHTWKLCQTIEEALIEELRWGRLESFIFQDNLCVYGVNLGSPRCDLFMLNLNTMRWTRIEQEKEYLQCIDSFSTLKNGGTVYNDHLVILKNRLSSERNELCFFNLNTRNAWSTFAIQGMKEEYRIAMDKTNKNYSYRHLVFPLMIFKNSILNLTFFQQGLFLNVMSLDSCALKSAEEEYLSSLFLSEEESDVSFRVENQLIPAHKKVLLKKSRFFFNLFNSGMIESRQDVIDIEDCEYDVFKEYLQYIYQETINLEDIDRTIKFYTLADKYVQEDLREKCLDFLSHNINRKNAYKIFDFALRENILEVQNLLVKFLQKNANINNVIGLIESLGRQENSEFDEDAWRIRAVTFIFILNHFFDPDENEKGSQQAYEDFICENIEMRTISVLVNFLSCSKRLPEIEEPFGEDLEKYSQKEDDNDMVFFDSQDIDRFLKRRTTPKKRNIFEERTTRLKAAAFNFVYENFETVLTSGIDLPNGFLGDFNLYSAERTSKQIQELAMKLNQGGEDNNEEISKETEEKMELIQETTYEENSAPLIQAQNSSQDNLPGWTQFHLKDFEYESSITYSFEDENSITYSEGFIMEHYLGVFVIEQAKSKEKDQKASEKTSLLTFNLRDHTVMEASIKLSSLKIVKGSRFLRYNGNQLIQYGGDSHLNCITIESFERIPF